MRPACAASRPCAKGATTLYVLVHCPPQLPCAGAFCYAGAPTCPRLAHCRPTQSACGPRTDAVGASLKRPVANKLARADSKRGPTNAQNWLTAAPGSSPLRGSARAHVRRCPGLARVFHSAPRCVAPCSRNSIILYSTLLHTRGVIVLLVSQTRVWALPAGCACTACETLRPQEMHTSS